MVLELVNLDKRHPGYQQPTREELQVESSASVGFAPSSPATRPGSSSAPTPTSKPAGGGTPKQPGPPTVQSEGLASTGQPARGRSPTPGAARRTEVARGTFFSSAISSRQTASPADLSRNRDPAGRSAEAIKQRMTDHRARSMFSVQVFSRGAEATEKIGKLSRQATRYQLSLKLLRGEDLMAADDSGESDPYCDIHVWNVGGSGGTAAVEHMWRSETQYQTRHPRWDKKDWEAVPLSSEHALLHLVCFDWDRVGKDDFLGECLVDLARYADGRTHELQLWMDQYDRETTTDAVKGHVTIQIVVTKTA
mmetsp:Transcript_52026/g.134924  ORF Transcript_52026/g.134924 Transcript_52026/m.134924 type:complete len:308 (+) Transcript_52026:322-1245(+)